MRRTKKATEELWDKADQLYFKIDKLVGREMRRFRKAGTSMGDITLITTAALARRVGRVEAEALVFCSVPQDARLEALEDFVFEGFHETAHEMEDVGLDGLEELFAEVRSRSAALVTRRTRSKALSRGRKVIRLFPKQKKQTKKKAP